MDINTLSVISIIVTILAGAFACFEKGRKLFKRLWHFIFRYKPRIPRETIRVVAEVNDCWWGQGTASGKPAMQVHAKFFVTNITEHPVQLLRSQLPRQNVYGIIFSKHHTQNIYGDYAILPGGVTEVICDFWIQPPIREVGEDLKVDMILTDQYANDHKIKNLLLKGILPQVPQAKKKSSESIHEILDPVEKSVVAILKTEVNRYNACGRSVGGLGSIRTTIRDHSHSGIGTEWRKPNSPDNQSIVENEDEIIITSDNADALLNLYGSLTDDAEKSRFFAALLKRMSRGREYSAVGYLILFVLFRLGKLKDVLNAAKEELQGDDKYGFSDFLRFLDGLLRFRHSSFTPEMLDDVDRFLVGIDEHSFRIEERLAAIRAYRLSKN